MSFLDNYKEQRGPLVEIRVDDLDRIVEIVEKMEWSWMVWGRHCCHLCNNASTTGHKESCPYHEEWKP